LQLVNTVVDDADGLFNDFENLGCLVEFCCYFVLGVFDG